MADVSGDMDAEHGLSLGRRCLIQVEEQVEEDTSSSNSQARSF